MHICHVELKLEFTFYLAVMLAMNLTLEKEELGHFVVKWAKLAKVAGRTLNTMVLSLHLQNQLISEPLPVCEPFPLHLVAETTLKLKVTVFLFN